MTVPKAGFLLMLGTALACDATHIQAVGAPGDVFRTGAGCAVEDLEAAGAVTCAAPAQLGFERLADDALLEIDEGNLSAKRVSCRRSWCGAGALAVHADYRWVV